MRLADSVLHRIVQCVQEGMLTGVDVSDVMRQIDLKVSDDDPGVIVMTPEYEEQVKQMHVKMVTEAKELADKRLAEQPVFLDWHNDKGSN